MKAINKKNYKGRTPGAKNLIQTDKTTITFYCSKKVWEKAKDKHGGRLSRMLEEYLKTI